MPLWDFQLAARCRSLGRPCPSISEKEPDPMVSIELTVINDSGIHARPAALIVETATKFKSTVIFIKDGMRANAKSIMNIMLLAAEPGAVISRGDRRSRRDRGARRPSRNLFLTRFKYD